MLFAMQYLRGGKPVVAGGSFLPSHPHSAPSVPFPGARMCASRSLSPAAADRAAKQVPYM
jgi:hypothetical protein